jgi:hypothetical protein
MATSALTRHPVAQVHGLVDVVGHHQQQVLQLHAGERIDGRHADGEKRANRDQHDLR